MAAAIAWLRELRQRLHEYFPVCATMEALTKLFEVLLDVNNKPEPDELEDEFIERLWRDCDISSAMFVVANAYERHEVEVGSSNPALYNELLENATPEMIEMLEMFKGERGFLERDTIYGEYRELIREVFFRPTGHRLTMTRLHKLLLTELSGRLPGMAGLAEVAMTVNGTTGEHVMQTNCRIDLQTVIHENSVQREELSLGQCKY